MRCRVTTPLPIAPLGACPPAPRRASITATLLAALLTLLAVVASAGPASAQGEINSGGPIGQSASLVFVPPFYGAVTLDLGLDARFDAVLGDRSALESNAPSIGLGYLHYLDGHGRTALGGALRLSHSARIGEDFARQSAYLGLDLRLEARWRSIDVHFAHFSAAPFVDLGLVWPREAIDPGGGGPFGRVALGVAIGPGGLLHADPYLFAELIPHVGVAVTRIDGVNEWALIGGLRLRFDAAIRGRDLLPCEYDPMEHGPCP